MLKTLAVAAVAIASVSAEGIEVNVYEGPTECEDVDKVTAGRHLSMHYTGTIDVSSPTGEKGKEFDSSRTRGSTFDFTIGQGQVIKGWDEGLIGLCKGAMAKLIIPAEFGYGASGAGGDIPGGATLNFDVEVVAIGEAPEEQNLFVELDTDEDGLLSQPEMLAFFVKNGQTSVPPELMEREDKDKDGLISWEEFSGPKGTEAPTPKDAPAATEEEATDATEEAVTEAAAATEDAAKAEL